MSHLLIEHNVLENIGSDSYSFAFELLNGLSDVTIRHNTGLRSTTAYGAPIALDGNGATLIAISDNILATGTPYSAIFKSGGAVGTDALNQWAGSGNWVYV